MKRKLSIILKSLIVLGSIAGVFLIFYLSNFLTDLFAFYTIQSNLIVIGAFIYYLYNEIKHKEKGPKYYKHKGCITICILITGLIYNFILAPKYFNMIDGGGSLYSFTNFLLHTYTPFLVLFDYLFFEEKGHLKINYFFSWLIIPLIYTVFAYIRAFIGNPLNVGYGVSKYPYFFFDYELNGYGKTLIYICVLILFVIVISLLFILIDYLCKKYFKKPKTKL